LRDEVFERFLAMVLSVKSRGTVVWTVI
jgi:hypothetical protein